MYTFKKEERLCSQKLLDKLFHNGSSFLLHPFRIIWLKAETSQGVPAQVVVQVAKRRFKRAVDRNLIKRRIKEIYRLHKAEMLYSFLPADQTLLFGINYVGQDIPEYGPLEEKLKKALKKLAAEYEQAQDSKTKWKSCWPISFFSWLRFINTYCLHYWGHPAVLHPLARNMA